VNVASAAAHQSANGTVHYQRYGGGLPNAGETVIAMVVIGHCRATYVRDAATRKWTIVQLPYVQAEQCEAGQASLLNYPSVAAMRRGFLPFLDRQASVVRLAFARAQ
jgi:hypothetical protein